MEPVPAPPDAHRSARRILLAAVTVLSIHFALTLKDSVQALVRAPTRAQLIAAAINGVDSQGYYAWLRSALVDGDLDFDNEFAFFNEHWPGKYAGRTPIGMHINHWSVGPALAWVAGVVPVHVLLGAFDARGEGGEVGYTPPYQIAVAVVTFALALLTLLYAYRTARRFAAPVPAAVAASAMILGTTLLYYATVAPGMSHGPASAALAAFAFVWVRTLGATRPHRWLGVGMLLGVACLMRWQLATFCVLPALEAAWLAARGGRGLLRPGGLLCLAAVGTVVAFSPQMIAWQAVYGTPLVGQHSLSVRRALQPAVGTVLGSLDRSFFYWTPVTLVALLCGAFAVARHTRRVGPASLMLLLAVSLQIYAMAALLGGNIYLGSSFGFRFLTETCALLAPGLALFLHRARPGVARVAALVVCVLVLWNSMMVFGCRLDRVPIAGPGSPTELLRAAWRTVVLRPLDAALILAACGWFVAAVFAGLRCQSEAVVAQPEPAPVRRAA